MDMDTVDVRHRDDMSAIIDTLRPIFEETNSDKLIPLIPEITQTCVRLVSEDPRLIEFVTTVIDTAISGYMGDWAAADEERLQVISAHGWWQLKDSLKNAFPDHYGDGRA